jgi:hypothetical protein
MVLSGQPLHAMATLTSGKELPLPIEQGASWAPGQALRLRKRGDLLPLLIFKPRFLVIFP